MLAVADDASLLLDVDNQSHNLRLLGFGVQNLELLEHFLIQNIPGADPARLGGRNKGFTLAVKIKGGNLAHCFYFTIKSVVEVPDHAAINIAVGVIVSVVDGDPVW